LTLTRTRITDGGLKDLATMKELKLDGSRVTNAGIAELRKALPDCKMP
jgi:hypothetical protein